MATWIVGGVLALAVMAVIIKMIRNKQKGKNSCGSHCEECPYSEHCMDKKEKSFFD